MNYGQVFAFFFGITAILLVCLWLLVSVIGVVPVFVVLGLASLVGFVAVIIEYLTSHR